MGAANAELLQRCLARLMLWKDQLLQHCMDHESAMRQYCMDVESAMSCQEQRLMGQAANNLQQRDAALTALHRVEEEVLHLKATVAVRNECIRIGCCKCSDEGSLAVSCNVSCSGQYTSPVGSW